MPKCTILVGVPGSGKSTWYDKNKTAESVVISTDNTIQFLGDLYGFTYNEIFTDTIKLAEKVMWKWIGNNAERGNDIVIDRTNMTAWSRKRFIDKLRPHGYEFECVVFPTPEPEEWKRRLDSRPGKIIPQEAIDRMVNGYDAPTEQEGFTKITFL